MSSVSTFYQRLSLQVEALSDPQLPLISNLANFSALLWLELEQINWAGSYLYDHHLQQLVLGPFQGKPACARIPIDKGVCGRAYQQQCSMVVADVEEFVGHIACDAASRSEIVIPLYHQSTLIGVVDIDSPILSRFNEDDRVGLEAVVKTLEKSLLRADF